MGAFLRAAARGFQQPREDRVSVTVTHVGATKKYVEGWQSIFGGKKSKPTSAKPSGKPAKKKAAAGTRKRTAKKRAGR